MKKQKLLKLTKLTVSNLDRIKGGSDPCECHAGLGDGEYNMIYHTVITCQNPCPIQI